MDESQNIGIRVGDFWNATFYFEDDAVPAAPWPLRGYTCELQVRDDEGNLVLRAGTVDSTMVINPSLGSVEVRKDCAGVVPGSYQYGWKFYDENGKGDTWLFGSFIALPEIVT
jgi:hypothetical protein